MSSPLYYNDYKNRTLYDIARTLQIKAGKIRMMNPVLYDTAGLLLLEEIYQEIVDFNITHPKSSLAKMERRYYPNQKD